MWQNRSIAVCGAARSAWMVIWFRSTVWYNFAILIVANTFSLRIIAAENVIFFFFQFRILRSTCLWLGRESVTDVRLSNVAAIWAATMCVTDVHRGENATANHLCLLSASIRIIRSRLHTALWPNSIYRRILYKWTATKRAIHIFFFFNSKPASFRALESGEAAIRPFPSAYVHRLVIFLISAQHQESNSSFLISE